MQCSFFVAKTFLNIPWSIFNQVEKLNILSLIPLIKMDLNLDISQNVAFKIPLNV